MTLTASAWSRRVPEGIAKALASVGFLATALHMDILATPHGQVMFVGLILAWFGDVFLLSKAKAWFLAGLVAFLLGHVAYVVSFWVRGVDVAALGVAALVLVVPALVVWRWLKERAGPLKRPVAAYILVISVMLAFAVGTHSARGGWVLLLGAGLFYISDLFVARERFVQKSFINRLIGLPIYYVAQLVLASWAGA